MTVERHLLAEVVEHHRAAEGVRQRRDEHAVVPARRDAGQGGGRVSAQSVGDDPLGVEQDLRACVAIVRQLEPILLREPADQPKKWLARPQGSATPEFLAALRDFMYWENYDVRVRMDGKIDRVVLEDILRKRGGGRKS